MNDNKKVIFVDNVAIIQSQEGNSQLFPTISTKDFFKFTGDITGTIEIRPREMTEKKNRLNITIYLELISNVGMKKKNLKSCINPG